MWLKQPWGSQNAELEGEKIQSPLRCVRERGLNTDRDVMITFFIHYFHNDYHYVQPLIEIFFFFASQVCVQKNNYHLSNGKTEARHFHGHSICELWVIVREYFFLLLLWAILNKHLVNHIVFYCITTAWWADLASSFVQPVQKRRMQTSTFI